MCSMKAPAYYTLDCGLGSLERQGASALELEERMIPNWAHGSCWDI
jgi:hypothetical protein